MKLLSNFRVVVVPIISLSLSYIVGAHNFFEELSGNQNEYVERGEGSREDDKGKLFSILSSLYNLSRNSK